MEPKYRVVRYSDVYLDISPEEAGVAGYSEMVESDQNGHLPIVEVIEVATGKKIDIDLADHIDAVEGGAW